MKKNTLRLIDLNIRAALLAARRLVNYYRYIVGIYVYLVGIYVYYISV